MNTPHEKALSKSAGPQYKKGFTKGDLLKHKRENLRLRLGSGPKHIGKMTDPDRTTEAEKKKYRENMGK